jgi:hypothetical protein
MKAFTVRVSALLALTISACTTPRDQSLAVDGAVRGGPDAGGGQGGSLVGGSGGGTAIDARVVGPLPDGATDRTSGSGGASGDRDAALDRAEADSTPGGFTLSITVMGGGAVTSPGHGIDCSGVCPFTFPAGTTVELGATPATGTRFSGWSGDCAGAGACTVTMDRDRSVTAAFGSLLVWETARGNSAEHIVATSDAIYMAGTFSDTVDFGGQSLTCTTSQDISLARYDSDGKLVWVKQYVSSSYDTPVSLVLAPDGDLIFSGRFQTPQIQVGTVSVTASDIGGFSSFIARVSPAGETRWAVPRLIGYGNVVVDRAGNLITAGFAPAREGTVSKLDASGHLLWALPINSPLEAQTVQVAPDGTIYACGRLGASLPLGQGKTLVKEGDADLVIAKLTSGGDFLWGVGFPTVKGYPFCGTLELDQSGDVLVTAGSDGGIRVGGQLHQSAGDYDVVMAKLASGDGKVIWARTFGGTAYDYARLTSDVGGELLMSTISFGSADIGAGVMDGSQLARVSNKNGAFLQSLPIPIGFLGTFTRHPSGDLIMGGKSLARVALP